MFAATVDKVISVISHSNNSVVSKISVANLPFGLAYDSAKRNLCDKLQYSQHSDRDIRFYLSISHHDVEHFYAALTTSSTLPSSSSTSSTTSSSSSAGSSSISWGYVELVAINATLFLLLCGPFAIRKKEDRRDW